MPEMYLFIWLILPIMRRMQPNFHGSKMLNKEMKQKMKEFAAFRADRVVVTK